jgi:hypothetical protein
MSNKGNEVIESISETSKAIIDHYKESTNQFIRMVQEILSLRKIRKTLNATINSVVLELSIPNANIENVIKTLKASIDTNDKLYLEDHLDTFKKSILENQYNDLFKEPVVETIELDKAYSNFAIVRSIGDLNVQTRNSKLSYMIEYAEDKIKSGEERELLVIQEIDNSAAHKVDWTQPTWKRVIVCHLK